LTIQGENWFWHKEKIIMDEAKLHILREMPVPKAIMHLAVPTILSMVVQIVYNLTDTFFIGMLNDPYQVAAVTIALPVTMFQMAMAGIFGNGGGSYLSRLLGKREYNTAREVTSEAIMGSFVTSFIVGIIGLLLIPKILVAVGASVNTEGFTGDYIRIILIGTPIVMLNFALTQLIRAEGGAKTAMVGLLIGTGVNIVLDPIFIFAFKMGVTGAAVATIIGNGCGLLWYIRYYLQRRSIAMPSLKLCRLNLKVYAEIFKIGIPASLGQIVATLGSSLSYNLAAGYGDYQVAGLGVAMRVFTIPIFVFLGMAIGVQPLIGYSYGAGMIPRMKETIRTALTISLSLAAFFSLIFSLFPKELTMIFIRDPHVVQLGTLVLSAYVFAIPFAASGMIFMTTLQALGKALPALIVGISRQGLAYVPAVLLLDKLSGFEGIVIAMPIADGITTLTSFTFVYFIFKGLRNHPAKIPDELLE